MIFEDSKLEGLVQNLTLELRASEARFHNIVSISTDGILIVDGFGMILFVNPTSLSLFGRKAGKLLGNPFGFPVVAGENTELNIVATRQGKAKIAEMRVVVTEWEGNPAYLITLREITERKHAEFEIKRLNMDLAEKADELEAANQELEAFNYKVAHDLRQPLNALSNYCQVIDKLWGDQLEEECRDYLRKSYNSTQRMDHLIERLLNFSRKGHDQPRRELVDLCVLAHKVATMLEETEPERKVEFRIADSIVANGEPKLLEIVVHNLLDNAWKYTSMRKKAVIEFGVKDVDGAPSYFVRDNGSGFDMTAAEKLFAPFQHLPGAEEYRGSGIGLATVERIIHRHGGKVWAEGEPGKGACIYFTLG